MVIRSQELAKSRKLTGDEASIQSYNEFHPWTHSPVSLVLLDNKVYHLLFMSLEQPMLAADVTTAKVPHVHYMMVYIDTSGQLKFDSSPSLQRYEQQIFTPHIQKWLLDITSFNNRSEIGFRKFDYQAHQTIMANFNDASSCDSLGSQEQTSRSVITLKIGDRAKVESFYFAAFRAFQQLNCRQVAKAFIKSIEPRKQVKHPYNGGKGPEGEKGDPEKTKPDWWPAEVNHQEPDHLRKPGLLLISLLFKSSYVLTRQLSPPTTTRAYYPELGQNAWNHGR